MIQWLYRYWMGNLFVYPWKMKMILQYQRKLYKEAIGVGWWLFRVYFRVGLLCVMDRSKIAGQESYTRKLNAHNKLTCLTTKYYTQYIWYKAWEKKRKVVKEILIFFKDILFLLSTVESMILTRAYARAHHSCSL